MTLSPAWLRAHEAWLTPPEYPEPDCTTCFGDGPVLNPDLYREARVDYWLDLCDGHPAEVLDEYMEACTDCDGEGFVDHESDYDAAYREWLDI